MVNAVGIVEAAGASMVMDHDNKEDMIDDNKVQHDNSNDMRSSSVQETSKINSATQR